MASKTKPIESQEFGTLYLNADTPDPQSGISNPSSSAPEKPLTGRELYKSGGDVGLGESLSTRNSKAALSAPAGPAAAQVPDIPAGTKATRQGLADRGIADERIGWNDKTASVTLDGNDVYKPDTVIDGTSYADDESLNKIAEQAYANRNDPLKAARDYVLSNGVPSGAVDWDGTNVTIGGRSIKPVLVRNGVAYIPTSQLDAAISAYKGSTGLETNNTVYDENKNNRNRLEGLLNELLDRREFSYDPEKDKAFGMYRDLGERLAEDAYRRTLEHSSQNSQNASGAVIGAALGARNNMLERLAGEVGNYYDRAYDHYSDDYDRDRQGLTDAAALFNNFYNQQYQANRDTIGDYQTAQANERQIKQQDIVNDRAEREFALQLATQLLQNQGIDISNQGALLDNEGRRLSNEATADNNILTRSYNRGGYLTPEEADRLGIRYDSIGDDGYIRKADGTHYISWAPELDYTMALTEAQARGPLRVQKEFGQLN